jgi:hypothetical protein
MTLTDLELARAYRDALGAQRDYRFGHDKLVAMLRSLPAPPAGTPLAGRLQHLRGIVHQVCALGPRNVIEEMLITQIIACWHAAADAERRSRDPALSVQDVVRMYRSSEMLLRTVKPMERMLRMQRVGKAPLGRGPVGQAPVEGDFDLVALDAAWLEMRHVAADGMPGGAPDPTPDQAVDAGAPRSGGTMGVATPLVASPLAPRQPAPAPAPATRPVPVPAALPASGPAPARVELAKFTLDGQRVDEVRLDTMPPAGTA